LEAIICFAMGQLLLPHFTNREERENEKITGMVEVFISQSC